MTDRGPEPEDTSSDADARDPLGPAAPDGSEDAGLTPELDDLDEVDLEDEVEDGLITDDEDDDLVEAEIVEAVGPDSDELSASGAATVAAVGTAKTTVRSRLSEGRPKLEIDDTASKWWVALIVVVFIAIFGWALLFGQGGLLSGVFPASSPTPSPSVLPSTSPSPQASPSPIVSPTALATASTSPKPRPTQTPTPTPRPTATPTPTPRPTASPSPTPQPTASPSPTPAPTPSPTPVPTPSPSPSVPPSPSPSVSPSPPPATDGPAPSVASPGP